MYEKPSAPITLQRDLIKLRSWKTLPFEVFFFLLISLWLDFVFVIATLEILLPNHTWNIIFSSKTCFVIIETEINQTLISQLDLKKIYKNIIMCMKKIIKSLWINFIHKFLLLMSLLFEFQIFFKITKLVNESNVLSFV